MPEHVVGTVAVKPDPATVLQGSVIQVNSVTPLALITIPAGKTWRGNLSLTGANAVTVAAQQNSRLVIAGTGGTPADTSVLAIAVSYRDTAATTVKMEDVTIYAGANNIVINLVNSTATTFTGSASAYGYLI